MNESAKAESHRRYCKMYLSETESKYTLDTRSGLYQRLGAATEQRKSHWYSRQKGPARPKGSWADWTGVLIGMLGVIISTVTLFALFLTVVFAFRQWDESRRTADASVTSASAAQSATRIASDSLAAQQKFFEIDERPYMVAQDPSFASSLLPGKQVIANTILKNIGKGTAKEEIAYARLVRYDNVGGTEGLSVWEHFMSKNYAEIDHRLSEDLLRQEKARLSSDVAPSNISYISSDNDIVVRSEDLQQADFGKSYLFLMGESTYSDVFKRRHATTFCWFYSTHLWHVCGGYNNVR